MNNQWNIPIEKLMLWSENKWCKYQSSSGKSILRIYYDQLMLISDSKLLESLNMNSKLRGIFKDDVLILIISMVGQEIRKLRFQLKADAAQCLRALAEHFPVTNYGGLLSKNTIPAKYRDINEMFKHALDNKDPGISAPLPRDYKLFIKLCLLDPAFPQCVSETMKYFQEDIIK